MPAPLPQPPAEPPMPAPAEPSRPNYIPSAPIPADPHKLATAGVRALTSESDLASARALFTNAQRIARLTTADTPPYRFDASFTAAGKVAQTGQGRLLEI